LSGGLREFLDFAVDAARLAGRLVLAHYQAGVTVARKADSSPVPSPIATRKR
jgi:hypothetical protein